jgi:hypothetical protein
MGFMGPSLQFLRLSFVDHFQGPKRSSIEFNAVSVAMMEAH